MYFTTAGTLIVIFMFADMGNIFNFGLLTGTTIIFALLADYFVAPALVVIVNKPVDAGRSRPKDAKTIAGPV